MIKQSIFFILVSVILMSCGKNRSESSQLSSRSTLNLNFTSNIINLDSGEIRTDAEKFVSGLIESNYKIESYDDDILYQLKAVDSLPIQNINIRFLKNDEAILNEFLEGKLDLISVKSYEQQNANYDFLIRQIENDKYSNFKITRSNRAKIKYLQFSGFNRLAELELAIDKLDLNPSKNYIDSSQLIIDTLGITQKLFVQYDTTGQKQLIKEDSLIEFTYLNNPGAFAKIEQKETIIDSMSADLNAVAEGLNQSPNSIATVIIEIYPEYYITSTSLKGLKEYEYLVEEIPDLYFDTIRSY
jgi:hypothetical protein